MSETPIDRLHPAQIDSVLPESGIYVVRQGYWPALIDLDAQKVSLVKERYGTELVNGVRGGFHDFSTENTQALSDTDVATLRELVRFVWEDHSEEYAGLRLSGVVVRDNDRYKQIYTASEPEGNLKHVIEYVYSISGIEKYKQ